MFPRREDDIAYVDVKDNRTSPTRSCLSQLNEELEGLSAVVQKLEERVGGALNSHARPARMEPDDIRHVAEDRDSGDSPLVQELSTLIKVVRGQRDRLGSIIDRLDL